jgi:cyclopropane fatty-acyl-phospholipid synthase-like methyltransferase
MSTLPFDPDQYKASQRQGWDSVASGWRTWWKTLEQAAQPLSDRMVELAQIKPGLRVLDIATGQGPEDMHHFAYERFAHGQEIQPRYASGVLG